MFPGPRIKAGTLIKKSIMQTNSIKRFELVELTIDQNQPGRYNFVTQPQLRSQPDQIIYITGIQVYDINSYANSQVTGTLGGVPTTEIVKAVLVLYVNGEESIKMIPLAQLVHINATGAPSIFQEEIQTFSNLQNVAWEKSYVQFSTAAAGSPYVIPFGITYLRQQRDPANNEKWLDA